MTTRLHPYIPLSPSNSVAQLDQQMAVCQLNNLPRSLITISSHVVFERKLLQTSHMLQNLV